MAFKIFTKPIKNVFYKHIMLYDHLHEPGIWFIPQNKVSADMVRNGIPTVAWTIAGKTNICKDFRICSFWCNLMSNILIYKRNVKVWKSSLALIACRNGGGEGFCDVLALYDTHGLDSFSAWSRAVLVPYLSRLSDPSFGIMCWIRWFSRFFWLRAV